MDLFSNPEANTTPQQFSDQEKLARLRLIRSERIGPITFSQLVGQFGNAIDALDALPKIAKMGGRKRALRIPSVAEAEKEFIATDKLGATLLFKGEAAYPARLTAIEDAPPILFTKGHLDILSKDSIAMVGARNASAAGLKMARTIAHGLTNQGVVTVSGLARGIDTICHQASLEGGTIACLAGGLDIVYPRENEALYDAIVNTGCLVSEMPLSTQPQARHFPRRNRLISGLCLGLVVIEAAEKSGSLITARYAADQGREVFAIPGSPMDPRTKGTNKLIRDGAILVENVTDILEELESLRQRSFQTPPQRDLLDAIGPFPNFDEADQEKIQTLLSPTPTHIDDLIRFCSLDPGTVQAILLVMELAGDVRRYPGGRVALDKDDDI